MFDLLKLKKLSTKLKKEKLQIFFRVSTNNLFLRSLYNPLLFKLLPLHQMPTVAYSTRDKLTSVGPWQKCVAEQKRDDFASARETLKYA